MAKGSGGGGSGPTVAKAYVAIIPTTKDAQKNISKSLIPEMEAAGKDGGEHLSGGIGDSLKSGSAKIASIAKAALAGAGIAAVTKFVHDAYDAFSSFEQLEGGVQTIFGDAAADTVIANARRAFSTVQMSANDYLNTVTSFSASLIQSLGGDTDAAANMADMAVSDMADNANKMGSDIASIQVAYQGFAKQNYSMLDNLKLGYGGTQQEMYRLLQDAASLNAEFAQTADFSIDDKGHLTAGFADITRAIHIVQENMGIAGASAQEAATTLEGSFNMMAASWQNFLTAIGTGSAGSFEPAVQDLVDSIVTWLSNALPRIGMILRSIIREIPYVITTISEYLPEWLAQIGPAAEEALNTAIKDLANTFGIDLNAIMGSSIVSSIMGLTGRIGEAFRAVFGDVDIASAMASIQGAITTALGVIQNAFQIVQQVVMSVIDSIDTATIISVMTTIRDIGERIVGILMSIGSTVAEVIVGLLWPTIQMVWAFIAEHVLPGVMALWQTIQPGVMMVIDMLAQVYDWISRLVSSLVEFLAPAFQLIITTAGPIFDAIIAALSEVLSSVIAVVGGIWDKIRPFIERLVADFSEFFSELGKWLKAVMPVVSEVAKWIGERLGMLFRWLGDTVGGLIRGIGDIISGIIGVITGIVQTIHDLLTGNFDAVLGDVWGLISSIGQAFWGVVEIITAPFRSAFNAIKRLWNSTIGQMRFTVPDWVPGIGGASFGMPKLASGGTLLSGGTVMVGEAGPEILTLPRGARVAPLSASDATAGGTTYSVQVGNVDLSDDDQVRRVTREYLEFLARIATPGGIAMA